MCNSPFSLAFLTNERIQKEHTTRVAPFSKINASWIGGVEHLSKKGATHILVGVAPFFKKCATRLGLVFLEEKHNLPFSGIFHNKKE
jgi:hypothetical protein